MLICITLTHCSSSTFSSNSRILFQLLLNSFPCLFFQGILHLKLLENLNLYYNRLASLQDVLALGSLQNLKELDLRLNPVVNKDPYYRLHLVQAISKLRKLGTCLLLCILDRVVVGKTVCKRRVYLLCAVLDR